MILSPEGAMFQLSANAVDIEGIKDDTEVTPMANNVNRRASHFLLTLQVWTVGVTHQCRCY